jgi:CRP/FNR family transcriptional regulator, cyclic AMP receptor protein
LSSIVEPTLRLGAPSVVRTRLPDARISGVRVLDEDPDLAMQLSGVRLQEARARLVARVMKRAKGEWSLPRSREAGEPRLGLLVLDGVLVRDVLMEDTVSTELLGAGDLVRPSRVDHPSRLLRTDVRWTVLEPARVALLGRGFAEAVTDYPEVSAALLDRVNERAERLAVTQAICQLNGVDRRVLSLLWHLAERWGRVAAGGVVVPLPLPHRIIASMVGARRPTISTAIARLVADGTVERRADGTWLLRDEPVGLPTAETSRFVPLRRRTVPVDD